MESEGG